MRAADRVAPIPSTQSPDARTRNHFPSPYALEAWRQPPRERTARKTTAQTRLGRAIEPAGCTGDPCGRLACLLHRLCDGFRNLDEICFLHYSKPRIGHSNADLPRAAVINASRDDLIKQLSDWGIILFIYR